MEGWSGFTMVLCKTDFFLTSGKKQWQQLGKAECCLKWQDGELENKVESRIFSTLEPMGSPFLLWKAAMLCTCWFSICTCSAVKGASILTAVAKENKHENSGSICFPLFLQHRHRLLYGTKSHQLGEIPPSLSPVSFAHSGAPLASGNWLPLRANGQMTTKTDTGRAFCSALISFPVCASCVQLIFRPDTLHPATLRPQFLGCKEATHPEFWAVF